MTRQEILKVAKPIMFKGEMVKAIVNGEKTETRRIIKNQSVLKNSDEEGIYESMDDGTFQMKVHGYENTYDYPVASKYFVGDVLYVPEAQSVSLINDRATDKRYVVVKYKSDEVTRMFCDVSDKE